MLEQIDSNVITIKAIDQIPKGVPNYVYDKIKSQSQSKTNGLIFELSLKIGARVMLTSNVDISDRLINGQIGTISQIKLKNNSVETIFIKFDDINAGKKLLTSDVMGRQYRAVPINRITTELKTNVKKEASPIIKRTQFPLALSWGCTMHKVQGLSLNKVVISFDLCKQTKFNHGQIYVALSRVTTLNGLFLTGKFDRNTITVNERAIAEYQRLREIQQLDTDNKFDDNNTIFSIALCNVRSLTKHIGDIKVDDRFLCNDIILCTETQMVSNQTENVSIDGYSTFCNISPDHRFSSLTAYCSDMVNVLSQFNEIDGISVLEISKNHLVFKILFLYRKRDWDMLDFYQTLHYLIETMDIDFVMGDFNLKPNEQLNNLLGSYELLVNEPTQLSGSILDHVYVKKCILNNYNIIVRIESVFFTDHELVLINVDNKIED